MAEFCKDCLLEMMDVDLKKNKIILSDDDDICEGCGNIKPVVVEIISKNPIKRWIKKHRGY